MKTECNPEQLEFHTLGRRDVIGRFDGGRITSDGGGLLLREVDKRRGLLVDVFLESQRKPPREIWLDLDATDDPLHGHQEGRFFHGYYRCYCYLLLYIFCGEHLLCARLRPSNQGASAGSVEELERIVGQIRGRWPKTRIVIRGDAGFCREAIGERWRLAGPGLPGLNGLQRCAVKARTRRARDKARPIRSYSEATTSAVDSGTPATRNSRSE